MLNVVITESCSPHARTSPTTTKPDEYWAIDGQVHHEIGDFCPIMDDTKPSERDKRTAPKNYEDKNMKEEAIPIQRDTSNNSTAVQQIIPSFEFTRLVSCFTY